jgi:hypothetical protein
MAATAPKMSAIGELPRVEAAPVFSGAPLDSVAVAEPVGRVEVPVRERVGLEMVLLPLALDEMEAEAEVVRVLPLVVEAEAEAVEEADEAEADEEAVLPEREIGPM